MKRRALLVVGLILAAALPARGEDAEGRLALSARAVDGTAALMSADPHGQEAAVPLADMPVRILVEAPGARSQTYSTRTDAEGRFSADFDRPAPGAHVTFLVPSSKTESRPGYLAREWIVDDGAPPANVRFFETLETADALALTQVMQVVTVYEREPGKKALHLREIAVLRNLSAKVWIGDTGRGLDTFHLPYPAHFELKSVAVNDEFVDAVSVAAPHGGAAFAYRRPIFPSVPTRADNSTELSFQMILTAPYEKGALLDVSWHSDVQVGEYSLHLEQGELSYVPPPEDTDPVVYPLADMGGNASMGNVDKATHGWGRNRIPAHVNLGGSIQVGHPFPLQAVLTASMIALIALAGVFLGLALRRRGAPGAAADAERATTAPRAVAPRDASNALADLERKLQRGEITSFEYQVRKSSLSGTPQASPSPSSSASTATPTAATSATVDPATDAQRILDRVDGASAKQLRKDVRTLAGIVRELLGD